MIQCGDSLHFCGVCGSTLTEVSPGKYQCDKCELDEYIKQVRAEERERLLELQPCGHPRVCIVSSSEGTNYCGWCASLSEALSEQSKAIRADGGLSPAEAGGLQRALKRCMQELREAREEIQRLLALLATSQSVMPKVTVPDAIQSDAAAILASEEGK